MALLSIYRGTQAEVSKRPVSDGALLFATDTKKIYLDKGSSRVEMSSLQDLSDYITNEELKEGLATKAPLSHSHTTAQVTGLDSALAGKASTGHTHAAATDASAGFMSAADKEKLDGIASGANKYTLPTATSSVLGGVKTGANITNSSGTISLTKANVTNALGYTPPTTDTNTWIAFKGATTSAAGTAGYVPAPTAGAANRYFRSDGTWTVPPNTNTTYTLTKSGSTITLEGSDGSSSKVTDANTTYTLSSFGVTATAAELNYMDGVTSNVQTQLNGKAASSHTHSTASTTAAGFLRQLNGSTSNFLRGDGTWATPPNTTYSAMKGATTSAAGSAGLVPAPSAGAATRYLRSDGTWQVPPDTNTTYTLSSFGITATAAEINKLDGLATTKTELGYLDGVTSNVQTQLNGKAASSHTHNYAGSSSAGGAATSAAKVNVTTLTNQNLNNYRTPGTFFAAGGGNTCTNKPNGIDNFGMFVIQSAGGWQTQFLYGSNHVMYTRTYEGEAWTSWVEVYTSANKPTASEIGAAASSHTHSIANVSGLQSALNGKAASSHSHPVSQVTGLTASRALVSDSSGHPAVSTVTSTELGYLDGVTSAIQTQLNGKASTSHTHSYLPLSGGTLTGTVTSRSLAAAADSTYDIGTSSVRYRNIYADNLYGTLQGSVTSANKLTTARTISLSGDVSGSTSFDGSANATISAQIAANAITANEIAANAVSSSEIAANAVTLAKLGSDVGTVAVQSTQPTDTNVKIWIQT